MKIFEKIAELHHYLETQRRKGRVVGLVPTMGALHQGHVQLVRKAIETCDLVVCSIFVNPAQFNNSADFQNYPIRSEEDRKVLSQEGCDVLFVPTADEMYPEGSSSLKMDFGFLEKVMEGKFRPGHFSGVGIVVAKLLNIVRPHQAFFGQKDLQQLAVIKRLVRDLNIHTDIISVPTVREPNGLAMSSRNLRLSSSQREIASNLHRIMHELKMSLETGQDLVSSLETSKEALDQLDEIRLEYLEVVNSDTMENVIEMNQAENISVCAAAFVGEVRIIDNIYLKREG